MNHDDPASPENLASLLDTHLCRFMNEDEAKSLLTMGEVQRLAKDSVLFQEGDPGGSMFTVIRGYVRVIKGLDLSVRDSLAVLSNGDILGEMSVIDADPRSATAVTASEVVLFRLERRGLTRYIREHPASAVKLLWALLETISLRLRESNSNYQDLLARHLDHARRGDRNIS